MKTPSILLLLAITFLCTTMQAQTYVRNFNAKANDTNVGNVKATKVLNGSLEQYEVESIVTIKVLFPIEIKYRAQSSYKDGVMISSSATVHVNDKLQNSVVTEKTENHYTIVEDDHTTMLYEEIKFSTTKLYFNQPKDQTSIYSESDGFMKPMVKTSDGNYKVKDPENSSSNTIYGFSSDQGLNNILIERKFMPEVKFNHVREAKPAEATLEE